MPTASPLQVRPAIDGLTVVQAVAAEPAPRKHAFYAEFSTTIGDGRAHVFMFHNNVADYVEAGLDVYGYLVTRSVAAGYAVIATLSVDEGITLLQPSMARLFDEWAYNLPAEDESAVAFRKSSGAPDDYQQMALPSKADVQGEIEVLLDLMRRAPQGKAAVFIKSAELLFPAQPLGQMQIADRAIVGLLTTAAHNDKLGARVNPLFLLVNDRAKVTTELTEEASGIYQIEVAKPDKNVRRTFIDSYIAARRLRISIWEQQFQSERGEQPAELEMEMSAEELAIGTAGLLCRHLEELFMSSYGVPLTWDTVRATRRRLIKAMYGDVLVLMEDDVELDDVGGHEEVKGYLLSRVVDAIKRGLTAICPQNVCLAGPPGTGKTFLMKAIGKRSKINMIFIDLALVKGRYVGDTEKAWRKLWEGIVTFGPCIVVFDEADTKVDRAGSSSADSGLFGAILENFGNEKFRGFITGVFISNVPRKLDAALLSRCILIPVLPTESIKVLTAILRSRGHVVDADETWVRAAAATIEGWDGREVGQVVTEAIAAIQLDGVSLEEALTDTLADWKPGGNADVQIMTDMALEMTSNQKLIPARYRQARKNINPVQLEADTDKILGRSRGRVASNF